MYNRLHSVSACNRQTDGQTNGQTDILPRRNPRYAYASRGNQSLQLVDRRPDCFCAVQFPESEDFLPLLRPFCKLK